MADTRIVPLKCHAEITVGALLQAMLPKAPWYQRAIIRTIFLLDRISKVKLW